MPKTMRSWDWVSMPKAVREGRISEADLEAAREVTAAFLANKRKEEIVPQAMRRKILMAPVCTIEDFTLSPHHRSREFFQRVGAEGMLQPGDFGKGIGFAPLSPAPRIGPAAAPPPSLPCPPALAAAAPAPAPALPFAGLKVLDLAWVVAGPAIGRVLADYGATVVRVESSNRVDTARVMGPFPGGVFDINRSSNYETFNAGKLGLALDLTQDSARAVARDLAAWADVVIESFAPGQMQRWQLGYDDLRAINPSIVMLSTSLMGQTGPYAAFAGFGNIGAAMSGFQNIVGWPGALPIGPFGPYTDYVGPRFGLTVLLAALHRRRATGEGAWLDISQVEAGIQFLAAEIAAFSTAGTIAQADGNRDPYMAPHGVFRCAGEDRWVAIAVRSDAEWHALAAHIGIPASDPRWATLSVRKQNEDAIESLLADWTQTMSPETVQARLQALGIPAYIAATSADMLHDPQLIHRGQFVRQAHENGGESIVECSRYVLSLTPAQYPLTAPSFGRDNQHVLRDLLGYTKDHIAALGAAGALV